MKLRAGILGLGVGEAHIPAYASHPKCEVVALCDRNREKLEAVGARYPDVKLLTTEPEEILTSKEIDVVSIASYDDAHASQILQGLSHGKHLFVEKPLVQKWEEAIAVKTALSEHPDLKLTSNLILRRSPRFIRLREMIRQGELGELYYLEGDYNYGRVHKLTSGWRGEIDFYSVVVGGGVHIIDLFLWLTGERILRVHAVGNRIVTRNSQFRYNDCVVALLEFGDGSVAKLGVNFGCVSPHFHRLTVYGTKATFENRFKDALLYTERDANPPSPPRHISDAYPGVQKGDLIPSFLDSILYQTEPEIPPEEIFHALAVCFAVDEAVEKGHPVKVRPL